MAAGISKTTLDQHGCDDQKHESQKGGICKSHSLISRNVENKLSSQIKEMEDATNLYT
jgi:hypothetical protein